MKKFTKEAVENITIASEFKKVLKEYFDEKEVDKKLENSFDCCGETINGMMDNSIRFETEDEEILIAFAVNENDSEDMYVQFVEIK